MYTKIYIFCVSIFLQNRHELSGQPNSIALILRSNFNLLGEQRYNLISLFFFLCLQFLQSPLYNPSLTLRQPIFNSWWKLNHFLRLIVLRLRMDYEFRSMLLIHLYLLLHTHAVCIFLFSYITFINGLLCYFFIINIIWIFFKLLI